MVFVLLSFEVLCLTYFHVFSSGEVESRDDGMSAIRRPHGDRRALEHHGVWLPNKLTHKIAHAHKFKNLDLANFLHRSLL